MTESTWINAGRIAQLIELGGPVLVVRMIDAFTEGAQDRIAILQAAPPDFEAVAFAMHSLKSSAANLGADALKRCAQQVEDSAKVRDADALAQGCAALRPVFDETLSSFHTLRQELA